MPKGVRKTVDQFVDEAVRFLSKKSVDAQEIIVSNVLRDLGVANREAATSGGTTEAGADAAAPAAPKAAKKKKKGKKLKGQTTEEAIAEPEPEPTE